MLDALLWVKGAAAAATSQQVCVCVGRGGGAREGEEMGV